jgi:uncharacterized lipoprotein YmbA
MKAKHERKATKSMITWRRFSMGLAAALLLGACAETKPSNFYLLSPVAEPSARTANAAGADGVALAVGPVKIPKHINRDQIVTYASANKINLSEFNRWGEPLADNFARVLGDNLAVLVPTQRIVVHPWRIGTPFEYQVTVEVSSFAVRPSGNATLVARWAIFSNQGKAVNMSWRSSYVQKMGAPGFEASAAALSNLVAQLSRDIAKRVKTLPRKTQK